MHKTLTGFLSGSLVVLGFFSGFFMEDMDPAPSLASGPEVEEVSMMDPLLSCTSKATPKDLETLALSAGGEYGVNPRLLLALVQKESGCDPKAKGSSGEIGLGQVMPSVWFHRVQVPLGLSREADLYVPLTNLRAVALILRDIHEYAGGNVSATLRLYNGSGRKAQDYSKALAKDYRKLWGSSPFVVSGI